MKRKSLPESDSFELYDDASYAIDKALRRMKTNSCSTCEAIVFNSEIVCINEVDHVTYVKHTDELGIIQKGTALEYHSLDKAKYQWKMIKELDENYVIQPERLFQKTKEKRKNEIQDKFCLFFPRHLMTITWWLNMVISKADTSDIRHVLRGVIKCMKYIHEKDDLEWTSSFDTLCIDKSTNDVYVWNLPNCSTSNKKRRDDRMMASLYCLVQAIFERNDGVKKDQDVSGFNDFMGEVRRTIRRERRRRHKFEDIYLWLYNHPIHWNAERHLIFLATVHRLCKSHGLVYHPDFIFEVKNVGDWMQRGVLDPVMERTINNGNISQDNFQIEQIAWFAHNCVEHYWENACLPDKRWLSSEDGFDALIKMCPNLLLCLYKGFFCASYSSNVPLKVQEFSPKRMLEKRIAS